MIGDLVAKLPGGSLSAADLKAMVDRLNDIDRQVSVLQSWIQPGTENPSVTNIMSKTGYFEVLPHECGSLHGVPNNSLTVPTTSWTLVPAKNAWYEGASASTATKATWDKGLRVDPPNGRIYTGADIPAESVLLINAWVVWDGSMAGERVDFRWRADDGSMVTQAETVMAGYTDDFQQYLTHCRRTPSSETYYYLEVAQYSGSDKYIVDMNFVVARLR